MEDIVFGNKLSVDDYIRISRSVGWSMPDKQQAQLGIENSVHIITAVDTKLSRVVGMARCVGDHGTIALIVDVAVEPAYQGCGIGTAILKELVETIKLAVGRGQRVMISLLAQTGKEKLFSDIGFDDTTKHGYGTNMFMWYLG